jgi:hypothetical protein
MDDSDNTTTSTDTSSGTSSDTSSDTSSGTSSDTSTDTSTDTSSGTSSGTSSDKSPSTDSDVIELTRDMLVNRGTLLETSGPNFDEPEKGKGEVIVNGVAELVDNATSYSNQLDDIRNRGAVTGTELNSPQSEQTESVDFTCGQPVVDDNGTMCLMDQYKQQCDITPATTNTQDVTGQTGSVVSTGQPVINEDGEMCLMDKQNQQITSSTEDQQNQQITSSTQTEPVNFTCQPVINEDGKMCLMDQQNQQITLSTGVPSLATEVGQPPSGQVDPSVIGPVMLGIVGQKIGKSIKSKLS